MALLRFRDIVQLAIHLVKASVQLPLKAIAHLLNELRNVFGIL
jgi:hypothetical protein